MNIDPIDDLLGIALDPDRDRSWLWNPFHPSAVFCALCVVAFTLLAAILTRAG